MMHYIRSYGSAYSLLKEWVRADIMMFGFIPYDYTVDRGDHDCDEARDLVDRMIAATAVQYTEDGIKHPSIEMSEDLKRDLLVALARCAIREGLAHFVELADRIKRQHGKDLFTAGEAQDDAVYIMNFGAIPSDFKHSSKTDGRWENGKYIPAGE